MIEYRVMEVESDGFKWKHGYEGRDKAAAYANLQYLRDFYGKYGRNFVMETRQISEWEVDLDAIR